MCADCGADIEAHALVLSATPDASPQSQRTLGVADQQLLRVHLDLRKWSAPIAADDAGLSIAIDHEAAGQTGTVVPSSDKGCDRIGPAKAEPALKRNNCG